MPHRQRGTAAGVDAIRLASVDKGKVATGRGKAREDVVWCIGRYLKLNFRIDGSAGTARGRVADFEDLEGMGIELSGEILTPGN